MKNFILTWSGNNDSLFYLGFGSLGFDLDLDLVLDLDSSHLVSWVSELS